MLWSKHLLALQQRYINKDFTIYAESCHDWNDSLTSMEYKVYFRQNVQKFILYNESERWAQPKLLKYPKFQSFQYTKVLYGFRRTGI